MTTHDRPYFVKDKEQKSITNNPPTQPLISVENPSLLPQFVENVPNPQITSTPMNMTIPTETFLPSFPSNPTPDALFFRAIQDSGQIQSSHSSSFDQQGWEATLSQDFQNPLYMQSQFQQPPPHLSFQPNMQQFNPMGFDGQPFLPYDLPPPGTFPGYPIAPMGTPMPTNYDNNKMYLGDRVIPHQLCRCLMKLYHFTLNKRLHLVQQTDKLYNLFHLKCYVIYLKNHK